ncbi:MAG: hypothetical protein CMN73_09795 [Sphingomonas sp.]|nr:hypothetical protein [Sphingomonas sp.]|tara:strand:- start:1340 stop:2020 length:681 start_codon:yes stop_codon:yes gene_type:complete
MAGWKLDEADHARVTAAVAEAERGTNGEIVTILSDQSDSYRDVALHYAVAAMLLVGGLCALFPAVPEWLVTLGHGGWIDTVAPGLLIFATVMVQVVAFLAVRYGLEYRPLRMALTPKATKSRRVQRRALALFRASAEKRTAAREGILLYLSLAEHRAEIIADEAIHKAVPMERWGDAMAALIDRVRAGDPAGGMADAVTQIGAILSEHLPKTDDDENELPDRLIQL